MKLLLLAILGFILPLSISFRHPTQMKRLKSTSRFVAIGKPPTILDKGTTTINNFKVEEASIVELKHDKVCKYF